MTTLARERVRRPTGSGIELTRWRSGLIQEGRRLVRKTERLLGSSGRQAHNEAGSLNVLVAQLDVLSAEVIDRLTVAPGGPEPATQADLGMALVALQALRSDLHDHDMRERAARLAAVEAGLAPLRWVDDPDELLAKVCEVLVHSAGFDRALLSQVEDSTWRPLKAFALNDGDEEQHFRDWMRTAPEIPLDHLLLESEMVRRHGPALVEDPEHDPRVYRPLIEASGQAPYVAAPIMPAGRVIGFLHADYESGVVSVLDRDILGAFADGFGHIFERAVLLRRLHDQREQVRQAMLTVEGVLEHLADADIELAGRSAPPREQAALLRPSGIASARGSRLRSLLTVRELEVLELMATGATNTRIAEQLVITDGTVKSHVKRILRKLHSANRSEAVARYLRLTIGVPQGR